jgi:hypothetical protein
MALFISLVCGSDPQILDALISLNSMSDLRQRQTTLLINNSSKLKKVAVKIYKYDVMSPRIVK